MSVSLLTPSAGLVALACLVPLAMLVRMRSKARRARGEVGLPEPSLRSYLLPAAALAVVAVCLGLAAMQPLISFTEVRRIRSDAEAIIALDTSRSMLARSSPDGSARIARAKRAAARLRDALPTVPFGIASITDRTLPHLFPSADEVVFRATLAEAIGIERPPPQHSLQARATSLDSLSVVATQGFFSPAARHRLLVVLTDGESIPGTHARLGALFSRPPSIQTVFVQFWRSDERVFNGAIPEPGYRPDPGARSTLDRFAAETGGSVFPESDLSGVARVERDIVGRGPTIVQGERQRQIPLAPYFAAAAFLPLALALWRRDR